MNIGILTYHCALNYGAVLQTYALQSYLRKNYPTCKIEIINYRPVYMKETYGIKKIEGHNLFSTVARNINLIVKTHRFDSFIKSNICLSKIYDESNIEQAAAIYDKIIVGSDQVWNLELSNSDLNYFLKFAPKNKRYSYAASIGTSEYPIEYRKRISELLNEYRIISVREISAIKILRELGVQTETSCEVDPTLLLSESEWSKFLRNKYIRKKSYILIYTINYSPNLVEKAKTYASKYDYDVIYIGPFNKDISRYYIHSPNIEQFITLFRHAKMTFVSSFHGTVFSIIFHKNFFVNYEYGDGRNARIKDLLQKLGLSDRVLCNTEMLNQDIDWQDVDIKLKQEVNSSKHYISRIISDDN